MKTEQKSRFAALQTSGSDLDRKFWIALTLYAVLAVLVWFTIGEGTVLVSGRPVELRMLPMVILGGMLLKTVLARQADKIRRTERGDRN